VIQQLCKSVRKRDVEISFILHAELCQLDAEKPKLRANGKIKPTIINSSSDRNQKNCLSIVFPLHRKNSVLQHSIGMKDINLICADGHHPCKVLYFILNFYSF
jgi:hypothetical protein